MNGPGPKTAVPSLGRSVSVVDDAIIKDEADGTLPRWPKKLDIFNLMPPTFYPYEYDANGRILDSPRRSHPMQTKVEEPTLLFAQPEIKWTPSKPGSVKLLLKANYYYPRPR